MKSFGRFLVGLLLLANLSFLAALSVHVVRYPGGYALVRKSQLSLIDSYTDTRNWSRQDLLTHAALVNRIEQDGQGKTIAHLSTVSTASGDSTSPSIPPATGSGSTLFELDKK
jgi:hypothetical protein